MKDNLKEQEVKESVDLVPSEKVLSTETAAKEAYPLDRIRSATFEQGANWQKSQDKELIQSLLDALKGAVRITSLGRVANFPEVKAIDEAITKAQEYLGTKS